jgi:hypothetical protein
VINTSSGPESPSKLERLDFLKQVIAFTEANVRSYDIKAQISLAAFVLSGNPVIAIINGTCGHATRLMLVVALCVFVVTIGAYLWVLWPTAPPDQQLTAGLGTQNLFYLVDPLKAANTYSERLNHLRPEPELTAEVLKLSYIRKVKSRRFKIALITTFLAYALLTAVFFAVGRCAL